MQNISLTPEITARLIAAMATGRWVSKSEFFRYAIELAFERHNIRATPLPGKPAPAPVRPVVTSAPPVVPLKKSKAEQIADSLRDTGPWTEAEKAEVFRSMPTVTESDPKFEEYCLWARNIASGRENYEK